MWISDQAITIDRDTIHIFRLTHIFILAGLDVEPIEFVCLLIIGPNFSVHMCILGRDHALLCGTCLPLLRNGIGGGLQSLAIKFGNARLIHHGNPKIAVGIRINLQRAFGRIGLEGWDFKIRHFARCRIKRANILRAKI